MTHSFTKMVKDASDSFVKIKEAYSFLLDTGKRERYDAFLDYMEASKSGRPTAPIPKRSMQAFSPLLIFSSSGPDSCKRQKTSYTRRTTNASQQDGFMDDLVIHCIIHCLFLFLCSSLAGLCSKLLLLVSDLFQGKSEKAV